MSNLCNSGVFPSTYVKPVFRKDLFQKYVEHLYHKIQKVSKLYKRRVSCYLSLLDTRTQSEDVAFHGPCMRCGILASQVLSAVIHVNQRRKRISSKCQKWLDTNYKYDGYAPGLIPTNASESIGIQPFTL